MCFALSFLADRMADQIEIEPNRTTVSNQHEETTMRNYLVTCLVTATMFFATNPWTGGAAFGDDYFERRTFNESFENGLANWTSVRDGVVSIVPWSTVPAESGFNQFFLTTPDDASSSLLADQNVLKLSGDVGLWQYSPINNKSDVQVLACSARKRLIPGQAGEMGWAGFGVTYYDASWNQVGFYQREILASKRKISFVGGFSSYSSVGVKVPPTAVHSIVWISNDGENTETWAEDLVLLNVFQDELPSVDPSAPIGDQLTQAARDNITFNSQFTALATFDRSDPNDPGSTQRSILLRNDNLWEESPSDIQPMEGTLTGIGDSSYWQEITVQSSQSYRLDIAYFKTDITSDKPASSAGVDFFDESWNLVGKEAVALGVGNSEQRSLDFTVPPTTRFAYVWVWHEGLPPGVFNNATSWVRIDSLTIKPTE